MKKTLEERFWAKVDKRGPDDCWLWTAATVKGYGVIRVDGKTLYAHRVSYELENNPIPEHDSHHGMCVCHKCDVPLCCNPAHLFLGTNADNLRDCREKGRAVDTSGEKHGSAKLTEEDVNKIREEFDYGEFTQKEVADYYGVGHTTIHKILHYKTWGHI